MEEEKVPQEEFITRAIKRLRKPPYLGIHTVYSGFNQAFREYFDQNPVEATTRLVKEGKIATRPVKGGVLLYLPEDAPMARAAQEALKKILEDDDELKILGPADAEDES